MSLCSFVYDNSGEVLLPQKFALCCLTSTDNYWYSLNNLPFDPLFDSHEVVELACLKFTDSLVYVFHKCFLI